MRFCCEVSTILISEDGKCAGAHCRPLGIKQKASHACAGKTLGVPWLKESDV